MVRFCLLLGCLTPLVAAGCTTNFVRRQRDTALLSRDDVPRLPLQLPELSGPVLQPAFDDQFPPQIFANPDQNRDGSLALRDALVTAMRNSKIVRVVAGTSAGASPLTGYDVETYETRVRAALAAFDTTASAGFYSTRFRQPPSAFFGPGLAEPLRRDEMTISGGLTKLLTTGGQASILYNPTPGYLFLPQGVIGGFNPTQVGALTFNLNQPLLRG